MSSVPKSGGFWRPILSILIGLLVPTFLVCPYIYRSTNNTQFGFSSGDCCMPDMDANLLLISIKSTSRYHLTRLPLIMQTWVDVALRMRTSHGACVVQEVFIVTDGNFSATGESMASDNISIIETAETSPIRFYSPLNKSGTRRKPVFVNAAHCGVSHGGESLACKLVEEFRVYYSQDNQDLSAWFCHIDDDTYVHVENLLGRLKSVGNPYETSYFLGKLPRFMKNQSFEWRVASGLSKPRNVRWLSGQALCLSQKLMRRIRPMLADDHIGNFVKISHRYSRMADDLVLSMLIQERLKVSLTEVDEIYTPWDLQYLTWPKVVGAVAFPFSLDKNVSFEQAEDSELLLDLSDTTRLQALHKRILGLAHHMCPAG